MEQKRLVVLGAGESGVGAAVLGRKKGFEVFLSDFGEIKPEYKAVLDQHQLSYEEKQHTEAVPIFDRRDTVSGVPRGEQRRLYDERKAQAIPENGLRLVVIHKSEFRTHRDKIVRDHDRDIEIVSRRLNS